MNAVSKEARIETRLLERIGCMQYIISTIASDEIMTDVVQRAEYLIRQLLADVEEQYSSGLISASDRMARVVEYHFAIKKHTELAARAEEQERKRVAEKKGLILGVRHQPGSLVIIGKSKEKWVDDGPDLECEQWETIDPNGERHLHTQNEINSLMDDMHVGYEV